jgi:4-amino-4-deoxy-L-arabinose transferase-like glycosyltransferase
MLPALGLFLAVAVGIVLRFAYPDDIEWKWDENWTFEHAQQMAAGGAWFWLGMPSSVNLPNPGLSLWVFAGLYWIFDANTPPELARAVQSLNATALVVFVVFAFAAIPKDRREPWLWAAALWAVNPVEVIYERKIWPPSVLPLASVAFIAAWYFRRFAGAAFAWGLLGALMTQVHMSAAFFALAVAAWTVVQDRTAFPWRSWLAGSVVGALPALPWLFEVLSQPGGTRFSVPDFSFFPRWPWQSFGFGIEPVLGRAHTLDYLSGPPLAGHPTYLMALVYVVLASVVLVVLLQAIRLIRSEGWPPAREVFLGTRPETLLITATFWGYGGLLTLLTLFGAGSHRHYLIVVTPILALWAVLAVMYGDRTVGHSRARAMLIVLCLSQAVLSDGLLSYIHRTAIIKGDFGPTWRAQQPGFVATKP